MQVSIQLIFQGLDKVKGKNLHQELKNLDKKIKQFNL